MIHHLLFLSDDADDDFGACQLYPFEGSKSIHRCVSLKALLTWNKLVNYIWIMLINIIGWLLCLLTYQAIGNHGIDGRRLIHVGAHNVVGGDGIDYHSFLSQIAGIGITQRYSPSFGSGPRRYCFWITHTGGCSCTTANSMPVIFLGTSCKLSLYSLSPCMILP